MTNSSNTLSRKGLRASGYVFIDRRQTAIYGADETAEKAWRQVVDGDRHVKKNRDDFELLPATAALLAQGKDEGGAIGWGAVGSGSARLACTVEEEAGG